jgi:hypothetical protein
MNNRFRVPFPMEVVAADLGRLCVSIYESSRSAGYGDEGLVLYEAEWFRRSPYRGFFKCSARIVLLAGIFQALWSEVGHRSHPVTVYRRCDSLIDILDDQANPSWSFRAGPCGFLVVHQYSDLAGFQPPLGQQPVCPSFSRDVSSLDGY